VLLGDSNTGNDRTVTFNRCNILGEFVGTAFLLAAVVGSGIMGERLANGNIAIALLANSIATGAMLMVLILTFGPISGAHFNPVVTLAMAYQRGMNLGDLSGYLIAQVAGAFAGVASANVMFGLRPFAMSQHVRAGGSQMFSEFVATFGLLVVILLCSTFRRTVVAYAVAGYITSAYWFTASTSFANPAVTIARAFTDTFAGIRILDVPAFMLAQTFGAVCAVVAVRLMVRRPSVVMEDREAVAKKGTA
jgi:glycerol uptake facilitator-like aquaporin